MTQAPLPDLLTLARAHDLSPAMALGLGAGVYFEYYRRPARAPTRFITGLNRAMNITLSQRLRQYAESPEQAVRAALRENALWFNLDRQPTTALLGMEMLAEELVYFDSYPDWRISFQTIARAISDSDALHRGTYASFLEEIARIVPTGTVLEELSEIADEWREFAAYLDRCAAPEQTPSFENASRRMRRVAFREEHFWGKVLDL